MCDNVRPKTPVSTPDHMLEREPTEYGVLLVAHGSRDAESVAEMRTFAYTLCRHVARPVELAFLELSDPPVAEGMRRLVEVAGLRHIVVMPLLVGPAGHQKNDIPAAIHWARRRWAHVHFTYGVPLGTHPYVIDVLAERVNVVLRAHPHAGDESACALLLVGRGSTDPDANSNLYKLARLLWEGRPYITVEVAFHSLASPSVEQGVERCVRLGAQRVVLVPHFLFTGVTLKDVCWRAGTVASRMDIPLLVAHHMGNHPLVIELVRRRIEEALAGRATMNCDLCKYRYPFAGHEHYVGAPQTSDMQHGLRGTGGGTP
ncbi:MAG: sirohydrochlorin chelatase [Ardenticatenia bacterium]|nr:sirohydrochlorin chelatase [Ardenticatenia bacterium]